MAIKKKRCRENNKGGMITSSLEVHDDNKNCYNFTDGSVLHLLFCKAD